MGTIWNTSSPTVVVRVTSQYLVGKDDGLPVEPPSVGEPVVSSSVGDPVEKGAVGDPVELAIVGDLGGGAGSPSPVGDPVETGSEVGL